MRVDVTPLFDVDEDFWFLVEYICVGVRVLILFCLRSWSIVLVLVLLGKV